MPFSNVPAVLVQVVDEVSVVAEAQSSFEGGGGGSVIQMSKSQLFELPLGAVLEFVNTLTRYVVPGVNPAPPITDETEKLSVLFVPETQSSSVRLPQEPDSS